jgi:hypothetical protein
MDNWRAAPIDPGSIPSQTGIAIFGTQARGNRRSGEITKQTAIRVWKTAGLSK